MLKPPTHRLRSKIMNAKIFNARFFFVVGLIVITSLTYLRLPCPACQGTGVVTGAKTLSVVGVDAKLTNHFLLNIMCGWDFERYTYDLKLSVENKTARDAYGSVMVTFHNPDEEISVVIEVEDEEVVQTYTGKTLESIPIFVEVPAHTISTIEKTVTFDGVSLELFRVEEHSIEAYTESEFRCPFHGEQARVSFTDWLWLR
jgi:RecJ-like exonuclease